LNLALKLIIGQMEGQGYQDEFVKTHLIIALPGQKGKTKKIRRKCATVARYSMFYRFLCNAMQRASQKRKKYGANAPQLRGIFLHTWPCRQKEIDACQIHTGKRNSAN
jgi:hypothetical protein